MTQVLFPSFRYRDADAAIRWMTDVLGGTELLRVPGGDDGPAIRHAEVAVGGGVVMLGGARGGDDASPAGRQMVYVAVDDADAWHARAVEHGAEVLMGLVETDYGSRDFALVDPEGNQWYFGTYAPTERPSEPATQELS